MDKTTTYLIIASQDFDNANHRDLWIELAKNTNNSVIVANIHADFIVSPIKHKTYRIKEALSKPIKIRDNLLVFRPLLLFRLEFLPNWLYWVARLNFWHSVKRIDPRIMKKQVKLLVYNAPWVKVLRGSHPNMKIGYYLFDEVRYEAKDNSINYKRFRLDEYACKYSDVIFTMTGVLASSRKQYNSNIIVLGNGASKVINNEKPTIRFMKSVAFVGVFRDWIDCGLLRDLITLRQDLLFCFVGIVTPTMKSFFMELLRDFDNTIYLGCIPKNRISLVYKQFCGVIIPYLDNQFIRATRPIKIVESVMAGTPVVTTPVDGYSENGFIRFARTVQEFSSQIDYIIDHPISDSDPDYYSFIKNNTWESKASILLKYL